MYLGKKGTFVAKFERDAQVRIKEVEEEKAREKAAKEEAEEVPDDIDDDAGGAQQDDDKDEIFLRQFPNLSGFYKMNKNLFKRNKGKKGFDITMGPFIAPTCCSMVVNFIQF